MIRLAPSILSADFTRLGEECRQVLDAGADMIHFDVMDGHFVDNISFGLPVLTDLRREFPEAVMDVHLMISHPLLFVERFAESGADCITFHVEADDDIASTIAAIKGCGCKAGLAVNPGTPIEAVYPWLDELDIILVMSVVPGHGGQAFIPATLEKLDSLQDECRLKGLSPLISVDGGVNAHDTGPSCVSAGADILVAGSALFGAEDIPEMVRKFKKLG